MNLLTDRRRARRDRRGLPMGMARRPARRQKGPIEAWVPVIMFAVVFGLSMDYEVFLVSRIREQWLPAGDASAAVAEGISLTGRVITAAAAIMVCVFLSFMLGDERTLKEFGFGLAVAVFLDALVVRCMLLPAVLELLGPVTWRLPALARRAPAPRSTSRAPTRRCRPHPSAASPSLHLTRFPRLQEHEHHRGIPPPHQLRHRRDDPVHRSAPW